ncbi:MAG: PAS domain S-box protein, partial [Bdellovibrionales bacterium]|nr:PAS domain S-box protein [Bdellovibrionales bacterium]
MNSEQQPIAASPPPAVSSRTATHAPALVRAVIERPSLALAIGVALLAAAAWLFTANVVASVCAAACGGLLVGAGAVGFAVMSGVRRAQQSLDGLDATAHELIDPVSGVDRHDAAPVVLTGFNAIDVLYSRANRRIGHLLNTLGHLGEEIHDFVDRYELLTNNLSAAVVIRDRENHIMFCSPYSEVLTGYSLEELYEGDAEFIDGLVLAEDRERYARAKQICGLGEDIAVRYQIRHRSGITLWVETHMVPVCGDDGEVASVMYVSIDVTASVRYQQRIEEQNRDLNDFAYMVSHDLKAPIFTIKGMAMLLLEDFEEELPEDGVESIRHIVEAANRLEALVKSVVEYSALTTKEIKEKRVSLSAVIPDVLKDLRGQIDAAEAEVSLPDELPVVIGEELRLYQLFSNLIGNALKYRDTSRRPKVDVTVAGGNG